MLLLNVVQWNLVITRSLGPWKLPCYIRFLIISGSRNKRNIKSWDQQNYLVIRGFCYIRPLYKRGSTVLTIRYIVTYSKNRVYVISFCEVKSKLILNLNICVINGTNLVEISTFLSNLLLSLECYPSFFIFQIGWYPTVKSEHKV